VAAVRTLVVSDFHLGRGRRGPVLQWPAPRERLKAALADVGRLVLLGDTLELRRAPALRSMQAAAPVLRAIGQALDSDAEIVLVPGNHDLGLIAPWLRAHADSLSIDTRVPASASPELERLLAWLGSNRVRVHYPGVWLDDEVWATHGHYLNRHLMPESSYGLARGLLGRPPQDGAYPAEYEEAGERESGRRGLPGALSGPFDELLGVARALTMPLSPQRLLAPVLTPRLAPLTAPLLSFQMRHASLPALARVAERLGVGAAHIIFGHVHRLGPMPDEDAGAWRDSTGRVQLHNSGSWLYEPLLLHNASPPHPYWPGGAILLEDGLPPRALGLLDDLEAADLHRPARRRRASR
jgi:hypothetical protein